MINPIAQKQALLTLPGMNAVAVQADIPYQLSELPRTFDLYRPPGSTPATKLPAVVFVSGASDEGMERAMGCRFKDMASTTSWARLAAASGLIGVAYSNGEPDDVHAVLRHIRHDADQLGIDATRIALWASSGHVPMALSVLIKDWEVRCAALLYGYMLDWPGSTLVADTLKAWGFANPASEKATKDLRADLPIFIARAGLDHFPHLNAALDRFVGDALARNMPVEVVNHVTGHHAFDILDDSEDTRATIARTLEFLKKRLDQAPGL